jgi:hypothetical protein
MVRRETFINKIRELNFTYKTQQKRTFLWRQKGTTNYISVPMADLLEEDFVKSCLRQAGLDQDEILAFIAANTTNPK